MHLRASPLILLLATTLVLLPGADAPGAAPALAARLTLVAPPANAVVQTGSEFVIEFNLANSGDKPWPKGCRIVETSPGRPEKSHALVVVPAPRQTVKFFAQGLAGDEPGARAAAFSLVNGKDELARADVAVTVVQAPPPPPVDIGADL